MRYQLEQSPVPSLSVFSGQSRYYPPAFETLIHPFRHVYLYELMIGVN